MICSFLRCILQVSSTSLWTSFLQLIPFVCLCFLIGPLLLVPSLHATMPLMRRTLLGPERRNPCTHIKVTRLFDPYGTFKCASCHKHPSLGWLYRCTQDTGGFLPESDFTDKPVLSGGHLGEDIMTYSLGSSIVKTIGEGHYTDDKATKIIKLKEGVRDLILSQIPQDTCTRPTTSSTFCTASSSSSDGDCTFSTIPQSTTFSTTSSTSLDEEIKKAYDWKELQKIWMSEPSVTPPEPRIPFQPVSLPPINPPPHRPITLLSTGPCNFMVCPTCRPTYRERAYPSLDDILSKPTQMPPIWEMQNRRISDAHVLAQIGIPKTIQPRFYAQKNLTIQSTHSLPGIVIEDTEREMDCYNRIHQGYIECPVRENLDTPEMLCSPTFPLEDQLDGFRATESSNKRSSLRQTLRKVLSKARGAEPLSTDSSTATSESGTEAPARRPPRSRASSSLLFHRRCSRSSTLSFLESPGTRVVDTSPLQESMMLMVATNTPLPPTPRVDGFGFSTGYGEPGMGMTANGDN